MRKPMLKISWKSSPVFHLVCGVGPQPTIKRASILTYNVIWCVSWIPVRIFMPYLLPTITKNPPLILKVLENVYWSYCLSKSIEYILNDNHAITQFSLLFLLPKQFQSVVPSMTVSWWGYIVLKPVRR